MSTKYWVVRGTINGGGQSIPFAWSRVPVAHQDGLVEDRLVEPLSSFSVGPADAIGETPPLVSSTLIVKNKDGALDLYLTGGDRPVREYTGPSLYGIECAIYEGEVLPDGTCVEHRWTPTMVLGGPFTQTDGIVTIPITSSVGGLLGATRKSLTVRQIREAVLVPGTVGGIIPMGSAGMSTDAAWERARGGWEESDETAVPWAYGAIAIPLIATKTKDKAEDMHWVACVTGIRPDLVSANLVSEVGGAITQRAQWLSSSGVWWAQVEAQDSMGRPYRAWVTCYWGLVSHRALDEEFPSRMWLEPSPSSDLPGQWPGQTQTPIDVLAMILREHSEAASESWDDPSFVAVAASHQHLHGICGGLIGDATTIAEIIPHVCKPVGISTWIGPDDRIHASLAGAWGADEQARAEGDLPFLLDGDIFPSGGADGPTTWDETGPADPEDSGAPASILSVDWASDQVRLYPDRLMYVRPPAPIRSEAEIRIPGAWIHPPTAALLMDQAVSARSFATRQASAMTHIDYARQGPGAMLRAHHGHGLGYEGRLFRLIRATVMPGERAAQITWEDCGALEEMRVGVLDALVPWLVRAANGTITLQTTQGSRRITSPQGWFIGQIDGCSLWILQTAPGGGAAIGSYRIDKVISNTEIEVTRAVPVTTTVGPYLPPDVTDRLDCAAIIVRTHQSQGAEYRPDRIRLCGPDGLFSTGDAGYQFEPV